MPDLLKGLIDHRTSSVAIAGVRFEASDLLGMASAVAGSLRHQQRVAVRATVSMETVVAVLGCLVAGAVAVPIPPDSGSAELDHLLRDSSPELWLGPTPPIGGNGGLPHVAVELDDRSPLPNPVARPDDVAFIMYTSGTTGLPKGVPITRGAAAVCLDALIDAWDWTSNDVLAHGLPLYHVHGLILGVLGACRSGSDLIHVGKPTAENYAAAARAGATMFFGVPTLWNRISLDPSNAADLSTARLLVSGSAPLPPPVFARIEELTGHRIVERYGMSETLITLATRADGRRDPGYVGMPVAGVRARVRDSEGQPVPHDDSTLGELEVRGPTLFGGYLNHPDATAEAWTEDGWFKTGDIAVIAEDGRHRIVGRESVDLIKSGGYRIGAGEIEASLLGHPAVRECAVVGTPDPDLGQRIAAYIVLEPDTTGDTATADVLTAYVGEVLSLHKRPRDVYFVDSLPRNDMGKVQKKKLGVEASSGT